MASSAPHLRWQTDGKFLRRGSERLSLRAVTYGPFPGGWPRSFTADFERIAAAGFHALRLYQMPDRRLLDAAFRAGLQVFGGLAWEQNADFLGKPSRLSAAKVELAESLSDVGKHEALCGVYVGNEIPADLVRWMGPVRVRQAIEGLIELGHEIAPDLLFAYANYPSTEYLEPGNADFTAFNVYLEEGEALRSYLKRLHHIAGDRPLVISEFGLDSQRNGQQRQAELLAAATTIADEEAVAGVTTYAWSDRWLSGGIKVKDWSFGLTDRKGRDKPALSALAKIHSQATRSGSGDLSRCAVSAIVCTRNGRDRIGGCLRALQASQCRHGFEIVVVDDGSTDGTPDFIRQHFPEVVLEQIPPSGLSAARNAGARIAKADILAYTDDDCIPDRNWLQQVIDFLGGHPDHAAVGGPNLPQQPTHWREAVVCAAPGAPSHVLLNDTDAEHLPGCNLVVRKQALEQIGGFDSRFHTAGDDVDFCWRLQDADLRLGFSPAAFVWHWRRPTLRAYLRQQLGYGRAERMLIAKHPRRFNHDGSARWHGFIYSGAPLRVTDGAIIYHGEMGHAAYQSLVLRMQPRRDLDARFRSTLSQLALCLLGWLAPALRSWQRRRCLRCLWPSRPPRTQHRPRPSIPAFVLPAVHRDEVLEGLLAAGWQPCEDSAAWDLEQDSTRVLLATELGEMGAKRTLVRVDGNDSALRLLLGVD